LAVTPAPGHNRGAPSPFPEIVHALLGFRLGRSRNGFVRPGAAQEGLGETFEQFVADLTKTGHYQVEGADVAARCILLRIGQWALDCRERIPTAAEFRFELIDFLDSFTKGMGEFRDTVRDHPAPGPNARKSFARIFATVLTAQYNSSEP
jgi:hypothetical protein